MELQQLNPTTMETIETRVKLPNLKMAAAIEKRANNISNVELKETNDMRITNTVYTTGKAVGKMELTRKEVE